MQCHHPGPHLRTCKALEIVPAVIICLLSVVLLHISRDSVLTKEVHVRFAKKYLLSRHLITAFRCLR
ncbi:hypothetical protein BBBOND_0305840 [Babesia bigemina]|uniref:Uncharacterized protein n=1 Tax=Babesia bigemina TaxID=5866 RepID=A0A061DDY1_BABBI|nr:hypothetical protein BBBOND_0305840 [Babesia bigemina]CDR96680.1 hypothetical protein BBBOND_0305840 [Babesia bigemina]|eukprot:XP_012768866.1 hypothetical protein BBBOND_0305840 [Babesia bigemina]